MLSVLIVQLLSCVQLFETSWTAVHQGSPGSLVVKNLAANAGDTREMWVLSLSQEDHLE